MKLDVQVFSPELRQVAENGAPHDLWVGDRKGR